MMCISTVVLSIGLLNNCLAIQYKIPDGLKLGVSSSTYQIEGAWNVSDKGENIVDNLFHTQLNDAPNGDVACDSYHLWERDIEMVHELNVDFYRFSISWTRLLPTGYPNIISEDGKRFYNNLIDGLLEKGIEPLVTLFHFDLPQSLQDLGGWANPLISDWFADYADVAFSLFADRVKIWLTINEPFMTCELAYTQQFPPYINDTKVGKYLCNKHTLIAHAKAYRVYDEYYRPIYNGKISLATLFIWLEPATPEDIEITELAIEYMLDRYVHPIFSKEGGWPKKLEQVLLQNAVKEGYSQPRLPPFTQEEIELVKGTYDFFGLNHYTTWLIKKLRPDETAGQWPLYGSNELHFNITADPTWKTTIVDWFPIYPQGIRKQLHWLNTHYDLKEIIITENGVVSEPGLADIDRLEFIRDYLEQILLAVKEGVNVTGYSVWSLMDSFEWLSGYNVKFGLYEVDFNQPNRTRTPRESAHFYANVAKSRILRTLEDNLNVIL